MTYSSVRRARLLLGSIAAVVLSSSLLAAPVINELMYHPVSSLGNPEDVMAEWLEIHNPDVQAVDVSGYRLTKGVAFTIPAATVIPAGGYLVIAADLGKFQAAYPGFSGAVLGPWVGSLASGGEQVQLDDALGNQVSDVIYSDEGEWARRVRGPLSFSHRGWSWETLADGAGRTIELRNPLLGPGSGQNWADSANAGGTPGAANSSASTDIAPLIKAAQHRPEIPSSTAVTRFSATIEDELPGATASLHWRLDGAAAFSAIPMADADADGDLDAQIPPQANLAVIEWYISATDGTHTRTWPAPARTSNPGVLPETFGQVTNALLQVDNSYDAVRDFTAPGNQPVLRVVMTNAERIELNTLQTTSGQEQSEAAFNATFVGHEGTGTKIVYNSSVRNRGFSSALGPPNNFNIRFRSDDMWNGRSGAQLNWQFGYGQVLGNVLFARAGIAPQDAIVAQLRINGVNLAESGGNMYGRYAMMEGRGPDWAKKHYPLDPDGDFYRLDDHAPNNDTGVVGSDRGSGELQYEGTSPAAWSDTFIKETNKDANDYTDLANLTRVLSAPATGGTALQPAISDAAYPAAVSAVLDVDQFYRYIATDALVGNQEGGLQSGRADDTSLYRGIVDQRFRFVPHDLDDVFDIGTGAGNPITRSIFSYDEQVQQGNTGVVGLRRMFNHPALLPKYYTAVLEGINTWFNRATIDPIIDQLFQGWVPATDGNAATPNRGIAEIKGFVDARRAAVLSQIQQNFSLSVTGNTADSIEGYKTTTNGAATFSGTFNVAKTYSVTVNGVLAQWFYRTLGTDPAGTWKMIVPAGGGSTLRAGLNQVVVRFWDGPDGSGNVVHEYATQVLWNAAAGTTVNGTLTAPGSLTMVVPESFIPGVPVLVRVDLKDGNGQLNRAAWNTAVNLTTTNGVTVSPSSLTLTNGMGSALVTIGGGATTTLPLLAYGTGGNGTSGSGTPGSEWKAKSDFNTTTLASFIASSATTWMNEGFDDSAWTTVRTQAGYGDSDENTPIPDIDFNPVLTGSQNVPCYLFRTTFSIADISAVTAVTGQVKFDDGYRLYVNGVKVANSAGLGDAVTLDQYATAAGENSTAAVTLPLGLLHSGVNTLAVEVHQDDASSSDVTFDLQLSASISTGAADPGSFSLTASTGTLNASKTLTSLGAAAGTSVSGTLPAGITNWSGVVRVTGDLTVPTGATLVIAPGTHVLMTGTSGAGSTSGTDLIVTGSGSIQAAGTLAQPISITAADSGSRWGEINVGGSTTTWNYCLVSRGCHSPGGGHTGTGPAFRLANGAVWTFDDGVIADLSGKTLTNTGNTSMVMRRSQFARCVMGPETDGSALTIEDCNFTDMLPAYRESGAPDDEDCIYIHDSGGRPVNLRRSVFANAGDDGIDLLAGTLTVEDCIVRNIFDKGMSLLQNNVTVRRTQIIDCDFGISCKTQIGSEATTYTLNMESCTIVGESHPTNQSDQSGGVYWHNVGVHVRNKYGTGPNAQLVVNAKNCIISAITPMLNDYATPGVDHPLTTVSYNCYQDVAGANPVDPAPPSGTGTITADPLFVSAAARNFSLAAGSPAINTADPALTDPDGSRLDMGALPTGTAGGSPAGEVRWTLAGSPYRITANTTVPSGVTLRIDPGVNVQSAQNVRITVTGRIRAEGTAAGRIVFSHIPGTNSATDVDPIKLGTQTGAPKWGGLRIHDSMNQENVLRYCDFINAQGTSPAGSENYGSLGFIRSWGWVDHCTFAGTHLRMCYGRNSKLTVTHTTFPDMFIFDPVLGRIEEPTTDFIAAADNSMEPLKVEYPTTDPEVSGANAANFPNGLPLNGHWRVYFNQFNGNRGHQDVFDCDSGRWAARDASGHQSNGQFVIDCRYNHFRGLAGDEHMDLGGDAYIASNIFENARKDFWTNDTGYSNAISSGDKGSGTTVLLARNICYDLDHVINCKAATATIFEHNTVANIHPDFLFQGSTVSQQVTCAPINFFVPGDGPNPSVGDGAYTGFNIISNTPHFFSGPDANAAGNGITTKIEFFHNLLDQIADPAIGPNHPGGFFSGTYGPNQAGAPGFVEEGAEDYSLRMDSLARGTAPGGLSYGAEIPEWAYLLGGPSGTVADSTASFTIGGPGIVAYRWRLNGGAWSVSTQIGTGGTMPRGATPTVRQATLNLSGLTAGVHTLEVIGQDMAGNWQDNDPARVYDGTPQFAPTTRTWTVDATLPVVILSEVMGDPSPATPTAPQQFVELVSRSAGSVDLTGWSISDDLLTPGELPLTGLLVPSGLTTVGLSGLQIDNDGDAIYLFDASNTLRDSVVFGPLPAGYSLSRLGAPAVWELSLETMGLATNVAARRSDPSQIVINEWLAAGGIRYKEDWVELANPADFPASLSGMVLTDARFGPMTPFPPLSFIGGHGFVKLIADGNSAAGANHTSFKLDSLTEELLLFSANGAEQHYVRVFPQVEAVSQGLVSTGGVGGTAYFILATGGAPNGTNDPGYVNAVNILNSLRITEIMYNADGGNNYEFIELTNTGVTTLDLGGVEFYDGIDFLFPVPFNLAPGAEILLVKDPVLFESRYGTGLNIAGFYTGNLDNSGEQLALRLPKPWDANVLCFSYGITWYDTNATGYSLTLLNNATDIGDFEERDSWAASSQRYGTPDSWVAPANPHPDGLNAWLAANSLTMNDISADNDNDGLSNDLEFSLNSNPRSYVAPHGADRLPIAGISADGHTTLSIDLPTTALAGGHGCPGVTYEFQGGPGLTTWTTLARKSPLVAEWTDVSGAALPPGTVTITPAAGGLTRITFKDPTAISTEMRRFLRMGIIITP